MMLPSGQVKVKLFVSTILTQVQTINLQFIIDIFTIIA